MSMYLNSYKIPCTTKRLSISVYKINGCIKNYEGSENSC